MDQADEQSVKLSNKIMVSSWMGDPMVCIFQLDNFFQVEFSCKSFLMFWKNYHMEKIPGGKICIFRLILLLCIAFHLYSISCQGEKNPPVFLAHLSRRLRGELLVYQWLRRPSSVRQHFQTSSPLKPLGQLNSNFIWRLLRMGERKFVQMFLVTWPRWPPCPYMVKTL